MAWIERLRICGLRNLSHVDVTTGESDVWLFGSNGAGKTTVLESVYLLSRGGSFRGRRHGPLTTKGESTTRVDGWIGVGGGRRRQSWRLQGGGVAEGERLAFPVRLVGSSMHGLLEGEPALRRRFVDWNLFHVEPEFAALRARFRRAAAQRNAWLRSGGVGPAVWDNDYAGAMREIAYRRATLFEKIGFAFRELAKELEVLPEVETEWRSELPMSEDLVGALQRQRPADVARGYTFLSPSRADFGFVHDGAPWVGSRGQNKLAGILLQIAADAVIRRSRSEPAVWLLDDPAAELDRETELRILLHIRAIAGQVLVTSLVPPRLLPMGSRDQRVFHVKQGEVAPMPSRPQISAKTS